MSCPLLNNQYTNFDAYWDFGPTMVNFVSIIYVLENIHLLQIFGFVIIFCQLILESFLTHLFPSQSCQVWHQNISCSSFSYKFHCDSSGLTYHQLLAEFLCSLLPGLLSSILPFYDLFIVNTVARLSLLVCKLDHATLLPDSPLCLSLHADSKPLRIAYMTWISFPLWQHLLQLIFLFVPVLIFLLFLEHSRKSPTSLTLFLAMLSSQKDLPSEILMTLRFLHFLLFLLTIPSQQ